MACSGTYLAIKIVTTQNFSTLQQAALTSLEQNVVVEWLALQLRIREVPGSNLCPETDYPKVFRNFLQSLQANVGTLP
jgi:hypothetical protein